MDIEFPLNVGTLTGRQTGDEYHFYLSFNDRRNKVYGPYRIKCIELLKALKEDRDASVLNSHFVENSGSAFGENALNYTVTFHKVPDGRMIYARRPPEDGGGVAKAIVSKPLFVEGLGLPESFEKYL